MALRLGTFFRNPIFRANKTHIRSMSSFKIIEHTVRAQHSRDRWAGTELGQVNKLRLHVKQYIPLSNLDPKPGDVTLIGGVANSFPKETLEPLWDDLQQSLESKGRQIRSIWIADPVNQGQSGVLNEHILGPDPSWWDHGRDLLFLINQFQDEMPHPLIGVCHSMGASHLVHLSTLHPRLFHSLVIMDTVIQPMHNKPGVMWAATSANRRDLWPSRAAAAEKMRPNPAFKRWDPRVLNKYIEYGLRELPTELYPDTPKGDEKPVTLQTTKAQELYNYIKPVYNDERLLLEEGELWREFHPEDTKDIGSDQFSRAENKILFRKLPELRPSVLYIPGSQSDVSSPELRKLKLVVTGTGVGGSGGMAKGRVKETAVDAGHLVPYEKPREAAEASAEFIAEELARWDAEEENRRQRWENFSRRERVDLNEAWMEKLGAKRKEGKAKTGSPPEKL